MNPLGVTADVGGGSMLVDVDVFICECALGSGVRERDGSVSIIGAVV